MKLYKRIKKTISVFLLCSIVLCCIPVQAEENAVEISAPGAVLMEPETKTILYEKDKDTRRSPASVTKIMTLLLIFDHLKSGNLHLTDTVTTSAHARSMGGSQVFLEEGETQDVETMIKCIVVASGNDASVAMAEHIAGSEESFVKEMNKRADELGMKNTHFVDCCGLTDSDDHYTTAYDMALIVKYTYSNAEIRKILKKRSYTVKSTNGKKKKIKSTNILLNSKKYYCVGKTGTGSVARYCFAGVYTHKDHHYVLVTFGCDKDADRWMDVKRMINACRKYEKQRQTVEVQ